MTINSLKLCVSVAAWRQDQNQSSFMLPKVMKHLNGNDLRPEISPLNVQPIYFLESFRIVGFLVSIPAMLAFGVLSIYYFAKSFFTDKQDKFKLCAVSYGILCLNQLLNICTGGILNYVFVNKLIRAEQASQARRESDLRDFASDDEFDI